MNHTNEGSKLYLYSITSVAILGGLLFGYDTAVHCPASLLHGWVAATRCDWLPFSFSFRHWGHITPSSCSLNMEKLI